MISFLTTTNLTPWLWRILRMVTLIYVGLGLVLFFFQKKLIYHPTAQNFESCLGFAEYQKQTFGSTRFYYLPQDESERALVYYHGNAGSACDRSFLRERFEPLGYDLLFVEYQGYSNDTSTPSVEGLLTNAADVAQFLEEKEYDQVGVIGTSLGSAVASYQAHIGQVDQLVLIAPFTSSHDVARKLYPYYPVNLILTEEYHPAEWLADYQGKTLIVHGDQDTTIPPEVSRQLYDQLPGPEKRYVLIPDVGHNTIFLAEELYQEIEVFLSP